jgi:ABC-type branched-subunit amino acid transport system ATPase component
MQVAEGEILGILGDNGAGKSTLMTIITGYQMPASGRIFVHGEEVALHSVEHARSLGIEWAAGRPDQRGNPTLPDMPRSERRNPERRSRTWNP